MDIYKHPDFELIVQMIEAKMQLLLIDFREYEHKSVEEIGMEALANRKAYEHLKQFYEDIGFYREDRAETPRRDME